MTATGIGAPVRRKEDQRFITGQGRYVDDFNRPGQAYAYFLRSPHAHANDPHRSNRAAAQAMPGVVAIFTGEDLAADKIGGLICGWMIHSKDGTPMKAGPHPALAQGKVRYVGDHVAVVIAETLAQAQDAAEAIAVDYEVLPAVVDYRDGAAARRPRSTRSRRTTPCSTGISATRTRPSGFRQAAKHVTKIDLVNNRLVPNAMEPRAAFGEYDSGTDDYTLYTTSQNPHVARLVLSAFIGIAPEHKLRVIAPDVGGGFGSKIFIYAEETVCVWAAKKVGASGEMDVPIAPRRSCPTRMAATTSPTPNWRSTRTARSSACGSRPRPISAPTCRPSRPRCRPISTRRCCPASTTSRRSTARSTRSTPTPRRSMPIAAPGGRRRPSCVERLVEKAARELGPGPGRVPPQGTTSRSSRTRRRSS